MATVRITRGAAITLRGALLCLDVLNVPETRALAELQSALRVSPKKKAQRRAQRVKVEGKRATKREETSAIREAVFARTNVCDLCHDRTPTEMHHAFGRIRQKQSERNCLAVCWFCHHSLTENKPSAAFWWRKVERAFWRYEFEDSARLAATALAKAEAKEQLAQSISMREAGNE